MRFPTLAPMFLAMLPAVLVGGERQVETWEGIDCFVTRDVKQTSRPIVALDFIGGELKDADLKKLAGVKKTLKSLSLRYNLTLTDGGLKELACLENLEVLYLPATNFGDAGLKELAPLKNLQQLGLAGTRVTDAGLKELATLENLRYLNLSDTAVTDAAVKKLQDRLPQCKIDSPKR
ncbi:MAG: hypothetical protein HY289_03845 [Planctomycetes bacterium]|nr:hypothetical protein [Planctomycetota bacterium]